MELAIAKSANIALPGICRKTVLPPHSCAPIWGVLISTYAKLIAYSHRLKCLSNGHSRLNKCAINFARLLIATN